MDRKIMVLVLTAMMVSIAAAGCLGSDGTLDGRQERDENGAEDNGIVDGIEEDTDADGIWDGEDDGIQDGEDDGVWDGEGDGMGYGSISEISGWADRQEGGVANVSVPVNITEELLTKITFNILVEDSDEAHSETDEGSDPDEISVSITWGSMTRDAGPLLTPAKFTIEFTAPAGDFLASSGTVYIDGILNGGKPYGPAGFVVYVDQGFAYTINADYTYIV